MALEGEALLWFQWENRWRPVECWAEMKTLVRRRFRSTATCTLHEQWLAHQQTGSVGEYRRRLIELLAPLDRVPEEIAKGQFLNGLKEEVKVEVRLLGPRNLDHVMDLALMVEDKLKIWSNKKTESRYSPSFRSLSSYAPSPPFRSNGSTYSSGSVSPRTTVNSGMSMALTAGSSPFPIKSKGEIRRLSDKELQSKRERGLCYRCDEKWSIGHRCKRKELSVLLTCEEEEDEAELSPSSHTSEERIEVPPDPIQPEISLNSVMGISSPCTLKLLGKIGGADVVVMVDPGATHNFISSEMAKRLGLPVNPGKSFGVSLGMAESVQGEGECRSVVLELQGIVVIENFLVLPLGNSNIILGIQWLEKLGTMMTNWKTQTIKFQLGEDTVTLKGDPLLGRSCISLKAMIRTLKKEKRGFLVELNQIQGIVESAEVQGDAPEYLTPLLSRFESVFNMPPGLPLQRSHEHAIVLKDGTNPINVRPYRYPHVQKGEIERLVKEML